MTGSYNNLPGDDNCSLKDLFSQRNTKRRSKPTDSPARSPDEEDKFTWLSNTLAYFLLLPSSLILSHDQLLLHQWLSFLPSNIKLLHLQLKDSIFTHQVFDMSLLLSHDFNYVLICFFLPFLFIFHSILL